MLNNNHEAESGNGIFRAMIPSDFLFDVSLTVCPFMMNSSACVCGGVKNTRLCWRVVISCGCASSYSSSSFNLLPSLLYNSNLGLTSLANLNSGIIIIFLPPF